MTASRRAGGVLGRGGLGDAQGGAEGGGGEVGQFGCGLGDVDGAADVAGGDGEQAAAVGDAQRVRVGGVGEAPGELLDARVEIGRLVDGQRPPVLRVAGEVVAERLGGAEHAEQPVAQRFGGHHGGEQPLPLLLRLGLGEADQAEEGEVGVGGGGERVEQDGVLGDRCERLGAEQPLGGGGVGETVPQQPGEGTAPSSLRDGHAPVSLPARVPEMCWSGRVLGVGHARQLPSLAPRPPAPGSRRARRRAKKAAGHR